MLDWRGSICPSWNYNFPKVFRRLPGWRTMVCAIAASLASIGSGLYAEADRVNTVVTSRPATLYAVGDVMYRSTSEGAPIVGRLVEQLVDANPSSRVIVAGDVCNDTGESECYDRLEATPWGPLRPLLFPVPGNHDYEDAKRNGGIPYYFQYMLNAGESERGWHAFDWGGWRVLGLNSEVMARDPQGRLSAIGNAQMDWLETELREHAPTKCVLTYYHRPMYSSGRFASPKWVGPIFRKAYEHGVDLYFVAHEHMFSALPPLIPQVDANGIAVVDRTFGVPGLIGGTGGAVAFPDPRHDPMLPAPERRLKWANDGEVVVAGMWGVTQIDLWPGGYRWRFVPAIPHGEAASPSGTGACHGRPPAAGPRG